MKFLIDENVRKEVAEFLQDSGYDVLTVPKGIEDQKVAEIAIKGERIILTHDKHFANILTYQPSDFKGIIRIKIHPPDADKIIGALRNLFKMFSPSEMNKKLVILEKKGFRTR